MKKLHIGIDPGKDGFITILGDDTLELHPIPLIGKEVDILQLDEIISGCNLLEYDNMHCVLEDVHAIFGSAAKATFSFGWIVGLLEGLLVSNSIPYTKITPKIWQKEMHQGIAEMKLPDRKVFIDEKGKKISNKKAKALQDKGVVVADKIIKGRKDTKGMSLLAAKRLFPDVDFRATARCTKMHDGKVDSLLLAEYSRRKC